MTDEEKKAIEIVKGLAVYYDDYGLLDEEEIEENEEVNNSINIVINLIEKQSKEIEELKTEKAKRSWVHIKENGEVEPLFYVSEDKIKAKIEEIDEVLKGQLIEKIRVYFEAQKEVLQSLLEKE